MKPTSWMRVAALILCLITSSAFAVAPAIIPQPQLLELRPGFFTLCPARTNSITAVAATTRILAQPVAQKTAAYLADLLYRSTGYNFEIEEYDGSGPISDCILLTTNSSLESLEFEGYELTVMPDSVVIRAPAEAGMFYGVQSFLQLLPPEVFARRPVQGVQWMAPCVYIRDSPRFPWRGFMLDSVRHFFTKDEVKQCLDAMAIHKLNRFHWHLVDDQGWRVEILAYPRLTQIGAWRDGINWSLNPKSSSAWRSDWKYGGYYSQSDVREIVAYAQARQITVIPEIEMPGHSIAAASSYPEYFCDPTLNYDTDTDRNGPGVFCLANPQTLPFLQDILSEVINLFPGPYIHIGGDEVNSSYWNSHALDRAKTNQLGISSWAKYQSLFTQQIANWLHDRGRTMIGWSEIENSGTLTNAICMDWLNNKAVSTASARQYVIMTPMSYCYFNFSEYSGVWSVEPPAQSGGPISVAQAYNYEPIPSGLSAQYTNYILGAQANLWSEYIPSLKNALFRAYPRLSALAEGNWSAKSSKSIANFNQRLITHKQRLEQMGINYNAGVLPQLGTWTPAQTPSSYAPMEWVLTNVPPSGEIDLSFRHTSGTCGLDISWVALVENGIEIDWDSHTAYAGPLPTNPRFVLWLPGRKPNASYRIRAMVQGRWGVDSYGTVYLPNWN